MHEPPWGGIRAEKWKAVSRIYRRALGLTLGRNNGNAETAKAASGPEMNLREALSAEDDGTVLPDLGLAAMLSHRIRYFADGAVIGSKEFVNEAFAAARERFGPRRKDGARSLKGIGKVAVGALWSARDLRVRV